MTSFTIKDRKFKLRSFQKGDEKSLVVYLNNKKIYKNTATIPYPYASDDAKYWINLNLKLQKEKAPLQINFAIESNGEVIGSIGFHHIQRDHQAEIGYWLAESYWGQGIITEAIRRIMSYGFKGLKLKRIYAPVFSFNRGSQKVLKKAGFRQEGILKKGFKKDGKFIDLIIFAKVI